MQDQQCIIVMATVLKKIYITRWNTKKNMLVFVFQKYRKFWNILSKQKPLISEKCYVRHDSRLESIKYTYFFRQITTFLKIRVAFVFELHKTFIEKFHWNLSIIVFEALKQKLHELFYECCDLTEKVYLLFILFLQ